MKRTLVILFVSALSVMASADDERGVFFGGGVASTINDDCGSYCDTTGYAIEGGYQFNKIIGVEAKLATLEYDSDSYVEDELVYLGLNLGHTFNTSWVRIYGKLGHVRVDETDSYYDENYTDSSFALGLGILVTPFAHQSGLYFKLESMSAEMFDSTIGYGQLGVGFHF